MSMTNQCKSGVTKLPVQVASMSLGHLREELSETGKQQSFRPYRKRTRTSTVRSHGKAERVVTARRLLMSALTTGGQLTFSPVSWRRHERKVMGANLGDLAHSSKMTGRGGVAVVSSITEMERMDDGVQEVGGGNSIDDIASNTNAMERSTPALCILIPRSRVCHSPLGYEA